MSVWYFPSWTGDFRFISVENSGYRDRADSNACVLEIVDPTPDERETLNAFMEKARKERWTTFTKIGDESRQEILLDASLAEAGKLFLTLGKPAERTITAVRSEGGKIVVHETAELLAKPEVEEEIKKPKTKAASMTRPTPSCPRCVPGAVSRASEVLLSFLSPEQHETWARERYIVAIGGITGFRYIIAHRHSPMAEMIGRICYDVDCQRVVHFHDNTVPPEEEVLAAKLILEHREPWLRNEATMLALDGGLLMSGIFAPSFQDAERVQMVFKNPFGGIDDGIPDAEFTQSFGMILGLL